MFLEARRHHLESWAARLDLIYTLAHHFFFMLDRGSINVKIMITYMYTSGKKEEEKAYLLILNMRNQIAQLYWPEIERRVSFIYYL